MCWERASDKQAQDPVILGLKGLTGIADYFVICNGTSKRQVKAIADAIKDKTKKKGVRAFRSEADQEYSWIVLDYVDVIIHIFSEEARTRYRLEQLWGDAERIK